VDDVRAQAVQVAAGWSPPDQPASWRLTAALFTMIAGHDELPDIIGICARHRYQMNEVARCTQIALGVAAVHSPARGPITLIDLGTGAGLGLQLDRYRYEINGTGTGPTAVGPVLTCEVRGQRQPPQPALPPIITRTGIELTPVDLDDSAARAWLRACAPPEASALTRLDSAIEVSRRCPATIVAGDAVEALPGVLDSMPPDVPVIANLAVGANLAPGARTHTAGSRFIR
jgi:hypothetical protein